MVSSGHGLMVEIELDMEIVQMVHAREVGNIYRSTRDSTHQPQAEML